VGQIRESHLKAFFLRDVLGSGREGAEDVGEKIFEVHSFFRSTKADAVRTAEPDKEKKRGREKKLSLASRWRIASIAAWSSY